MKTTFSDPYIEIGISPLDAIFLPDLHFQFLRNETAPTAMFGNRQPLFLRSIANG